MRLRRSSPREQTDPLGDVLNAEQAARARVEAERASAARWLDEAKAGIARTTEAEIERIAAAAASDEAAAQQAAADTASGLVARAHSVADRATQIDDARLDAVVWRHVAAIVPGLKP